MKDKIISNVREWKSSVSVPLVFFCLFFILAFNRTALAEQAPPALLDALALSQKAGISNLLPMIQRVHVVPSTSSTPPLAQYHPDNDPENHTMIGEIRLGTDYHRYRKEFLVLSSSIERFARPDFEQYLTVLTLLSLSNENAHFIQHLNGSLDDFYQFYDAKNTQGMCSLYALQQHVSDMEMLETALRVENYFLGIGSQKGINAVQLALRKMELGNLFEEFRHAHQTDDMFLLKNSLDHIFYQRLKYNIASLPECNGVQMTLLDRPIFRRAIQPAENVFPRIITVPAPRQYN